ncbi:MAG TPA: hydrogenase maturation protease [Acidobacteriota bacterium]|nr:hydrogenase maturation protease [Acidobacteriota bacterium]
MNNVNREDVVLIGIGNNLLTDDGVGPFLAKKIGQKLGFPYKSVTHLSLDLLDHVLGHQYIYIFDSFRNPEMSVGEVVPFTLDELEYQQNPTYSHGVTIPIIFKIGKRLYPQMSKNVRVFGINVSDNQTISESFSDEINHKMDEIRNHLLKKIQNNAGGKL